MIESMSNSPSKKSIRSLNKMDDVQEKSKKKVVLIDDVNKIDTISKNKTLSSDLLSVKSTSSNFSCNFSLVVLAASFVSYMLASLLSGCFGVFFENMETDLGWSKSKVAFIGGLISALQDLTGPISSALTNQFGCRKTAFFGGLIASLGMIGSAFVKDFWLLGFLMGGVTGFGSSLVLVSSVVVVTYYFEEKPSFAAGLTISGGSLGQSIFSLIIIKLNEIYGRSGCFLILGGILLNIIVCASLFRPLKWELEEDDESIEEESESDEDSEQETESSNKDLDNETKKSELELEVPYALSESLSRITSINDNENVNLISIPVENPKLFKKILKSSNFINFKVDKNFGFISESCLYNKNKYLDMENTLQASELSLKSNQFIDEIRPVKQLLSGTADSISLSRCHSLEFKTSRSETNGLKPNSSVPTDLDSLESNLDEADFINEVKQATEEEYVVVDADDIENCGSNLILSTSQNAIYFPILPTEEQELPKVETLNENQDHKTGSKKSIKVEPQNTNKVIAYFKNKFNKPKEPVQNPVQNSVQESLIQKPKNPKSNQIIINKNGQKIPHKKYYIAKCNCKSKTQNITNISTKKPIKTRHLPTCPLYYINFNASNHAQTVGQPKNLYHVPNLFKNSYQFPLHFRNVYYYKSLLNLNMRIMVLRPHGAGALTVNAPANVNNVSLSCPDLNLKQILIVKRTNLNNTDSRTPVLTIKKTSNKKLDNIENLKSCSGAKVLNAGSILLLSNTGVNRRESNLNKKSHDDKLLDTTVKLDKISNISEDESDEDEDDDEDDDDEEEECDNCLTRTKYGNILYKYLYKPIVRPLKFIYYTTVENLKLFKLLKFIIFAFCNFILSFFYEAPFYFINSFMTENGSTQSEAGTITVAVGIVSVFSSIVYGYIGDSKKVNPIILYSCSLILCGICCSLIPFFITNYLITMVLMNLVGALISVSDVLVPIICVNIVGYDDFVNAYGLMFFCQGLASFSGPPVLGMVVDYTGNYTLSYRLIGFGICFSGLILSSILVYDKFNKKSSKKEVKMEPSEKA